jgi:hypothetical protein
VTQGKIELGSRSLTFGSEIDSSTGIGVVLKDYSFTRELSGDVKQRSGQHGSWLSEQFSGGMGAELTFEIMATSRAIRDRAINDVLSMFPVRGVDVSDLAKLTFDEADSSKFMYCRRTGAPEIHRRGQVYCELIIQVRSPDAWLRGEAQTGTFLELAATPPIAPPFTPPFTLSPDPAGGTVDITPDGSVPAYAAITINGPRDLPGVINITTGESITLNSLSLITGDQLVIDLDTKSALINGRYVPVDITSTWFELTPYTTHSLQLAGSSSASAGGTVTWNSGYEV